MFIKKASPNCRSLLGKTVEHYSRKISRRKGRPLKDYETLFMVVPLDPRRRTLKPLLGEIIQEGGDFHRLELDSRSAGRIFLTVKKNCRTPPKDYASPTLFFPS